MRNTLFVFDTFAHQLWSAASSIPVEVVTPDPPRYTFTALAWRAFTQIVLMTLFPRFVAVVVAVC